MTDIRTQETANGIEYREVDSDITAGSVFTVLTVNSVGDETQYREYYCDAEELPGLLDDIDADPDEQRVTVDHNLKAQLKE